MTTTQRYFNIQQFNNATGELNPLQLRKIGYYHNHRTGNYTLTYTNPLFAPNTPFYRQQLVALPDFFHRVVPNNDIIAGCVEVTPAQFRELGFVIHTMGFINDAIGGGVGHEISA